MSRPGFLAVALATVLSSTLLAGRVEAQPADAGEARQTFAEAARQFEAHNYALALQGFREAHAQMRALAHPRASYLLYNIGRCNEELGQLDAARDAFTRYLVEADDASPFRAEVRDRIQDLRARMEISGDSGGGDSGGGSLSWIGWTLVGVGGAAAVAGLATGVMALDRSDQLQARCPGFVCADPSDQTLIDEADTLAVATDVLLVAALTVAVGGMVLALALDLSADSPSPTAGCWGDGCQVGLRQRF